MVGSDQRCSSETQADEAAGLHAKDKRTFVRSCLSNEMFWLGSDTTLLLTTHWLELYAPQTAGRVILLHALDGGGPCIFNQQC